LTGESVSV
jgi:Ca2+-transporting ATPase